MHQTCSCDSLNLPGAQHINKVCLERHLTEGEVAEVGEPPVANDRLQKQVQNDSIYIMRQPSPHTPLHSDTFFPTFWKPPQTILVPLLRNVAPPRPDSLLQCCLVGKPCPLKERFLHGAKEMVVGGCQVWGCGKAGAGWTRRSVMQWLS